MEIMKKYQAIVKLGDLPPYKSKKSDLSAALFSLQSAVSRWDLNLPDVEAEIARNGRYQLLTDDGRYCVIKAVA